MLACLEDRTAGHEKDQLVEPDLASRVDKTNFDQVA